MNLEDLKAPFHSSKIHWRVGPTNLDQNGNPKVGRESKGIPLAYLTSRDVMDRLDEVCGPENWETDHYKLNEVTMCRLKIKIDGEWVSKTDGSGDTKVDPEKGGASGAIKRAAVSWGIGRYLYAMDMGWWNIEVNGRSKSFSPEILKKLNAEYEKWLICDEGPLPSLVERQKILHDNIYSMAAVITGLVNNDLSTAAEAWYELPVEVQQALWFSTTYGGVLQPNERKLMESSEFREAHFGNAA